MSLGQLLPTKSSEYRLDALVGQSLSGMRSPRAGRGVNTAGAAVLLGRVRYPAPR